MDPVNAQRIGWYGVTPYENEEPEKVKVDGIVRTPSDHMGLIIDFKIIAQK